MLLSENLRFPPRRVGVPTRRFGIPKGALSGSYTKTLSQVELSFL